MNWCLLSRIPWSSRLFDSNKSEPEDVRFMNSSNFQEDNRCWVVFSFFCQSLDVPTSSLQVFTCQECLLQSAGLHRGPKSLWQEVQSPHAGCWWRMKTRHTSVIPPLARSSGDDLHFNGTELKKRLVESNRTEALPELVILVRWKEREHNPQEAGQFNFKMKI